MAFCAPRAFFPVEKAAQYAVLLTAARAVVAALVACRSPLSLPYTAKDYTAFARLEREARPPSADLTPAQDAEAQLAALKKADHDFRQLSQFSAIWTLLADAKENGLTECERLRLHTTDGKPVIRILQKRDMQHREPITVLDADADSTILTAIGCNVVAEYSLTLRPNALVRQLHDRRMSTSTLLGSPTIREEWRRIICREVLRDRLKQNSGVLVGATRKVVRAFFVDAGHNFSGMTDKEASDFMLTTPLHGAQWLWFGGQSLGSNRYRDCSSVIIIGREELPVSSLEDQGRALWGDTPGQPLQLIAPDEKGNLWLPEEEVQYEMTNGTAMAVKVSCHPDPRIRALQMQSRELATRQLVERLRLARASQPKRVIIGSNIPIPGLPVDALMPWQDLCLSRVDAAITTGVLRNSVVRLTHKGLSLAAPRVFQSSDAIKSHLSRDKSAGRALERLKAEVKSNGLGRDLRMGDLLSVGKWLVE